MNLIQKLRPTNWYRNLVRPQVLFQKQKDLLDVIDNVLTINNPLPPTGQMKVYVIAIPFYFTILPLSVIMDKVTLIQGKGYIPRSISFVVDPDGNWLCHYALREEIGSDLVTTSLFIEAMSRTNNARTA
jgi:hypothetical protein